MSSGAFALYIDQTAGSGGGAAARRVIPLPPAPSGGGAINYNQGRISLVYDNFGNQPTPVPVKVRILKRDGTVALSQTMNIPVGLTLVREIQANDGLASFEVDGGTQPRPAITALVEYSD